ncbi:RHS repeat-associated core domain-containing protein [Salinactinospora qingdaonensis]|uniref:RHS repeat-associated core domain-containing protein n=1 Tax=Salinactinospora qingdaonensis TaxID=702744 RepID=A0ABP7FGS4_9ACTN
MSHPLAPARRRARIRNALSIATSLLLALSLLVTTPASAVPYNDRPETQETPSVAGSEAASAAAARDDAATQAARTDPTEPKWPAPQTQEVDLRTGQQQARTLAESKAAEPDAAVTLGAVSQEAARDWQLPEGLALAEENAGGQATADEQNAPSASAGASRTPTSAASPSASASASPSPSVTSPSPEPAASERPSPDPSDTAASPREPQVSTSPAAPEVSADQRAVRTASVEVLDREAAAKAGVDGLLLRVTRTDGGTVPGPVELSVDYTDFAPAFGGDYGKRLTLRALDDCVLEAADSDCGGAELDTQNDTEAQTLTTVAPASSGTGTLVAATSTAQSGTGDYSATPLSGASDWNVGVQTGDFNWSYPMDPPNVAGGLAPDIALNYSSQSIDGRTATSNNQTSWIGEGFTYQPGYIERRYKLCQDDDHQAADQCWARENAMLSLNGMSGELIIDDNGEWHLTNDDGARIEKLTGATNGDNNGEYWKVTTDDGTQYYFGRNRLPGWSSGDPETNSAWTVPVYGDDSGEPCYDSTFADAWCQQSYKWNLDYVVDTHGNAMAFYYEQETNHYGRNFTGQATPYDRGGYLTHIDYGLRSDDLFATAPARVDFTLGERCIPTEDFDCAPSNRTEANAEHWPDVPLDQVCEAGEDCTGKHSPTFFSTKKLNEVTTQIYDGSQYTDVDSWKLEHSYPEPGDGTDPALWLESIAHTGHVGGTVTTPAVTFGGTPMDNRVDDPSDGLAPMRKWRITAIYTEAGAQVDISYSSQQCAHDDTPEPDANTQRCYPVIWTPPGEQQITDWFHKYVVTQVTEIDLVAQQPDVVTSYDYQGGTAWHFDDPDGIVPEDRKTWSQFRGYEKVKVHKGNPNGTRSETEYLFFRGMDGDKQEGTGTRSVTITDSEGGQQTDHDAFRGMTREVIKRNGVGGEVVNKTITTPWKKQTGQRQYTWGTLHSHLTGTKKTTNYTALESGQRVTETVSTFDDRGFVTEEHDRGDVSDPDDDRCIRVTYARNTSAWILNTVSRTETVDVGCDTTASRPQDLISDVRRSYDGGTFGDAPTRGLVTTKERIAEYDSGSPVYQQVTEKTHDEYGRVLTATDALNNTTTTDYQADVPGGPATTITTTNPLNHTTVEERDPARSMTTAKVDAAGNRTELAYDPFGRLTKVWRADRDPDTGASPNMKFEYNLRKDTPTSVVTHKLNSDADYVTSYEIYDGLLRKRQTQSPAVGGGRVITDVFHNSRGLKVKQRDAYYNSSAPSEDLFIVNNDDDIPRQTETVYDGAGRATDVIQVSRGEEQWRTTTEHLGDRTKVTAPEGGTGTTTINDARGRTVELRKHHGRTPDGSYNATTYTYAKNGQRATVTDPEGNTWSYSYDLRGRKVETTDPDAGTTTTTYDALDRKVTTTDARGETIAYVYDALGRKVEMRDDSQTGALRAEWVYDTVATGQLSSATRYADGDAYTTSILGYNERNQPRATEISIPSSEGELAGDYMFLTLYNPDGSVQGRRMPAAGGLGLEVLAYDYNDLGMPTTLTGDDDIITDTTYTPDGKLLQRTFDSGNDAAWDTRAYEEATNRLSMNSIVPEVGTGSLVDRTYNYDDAGNILRIGDEPSGNGIASDVQCFEYDHQRRLTEAWTPDATGENACDADPEAQNLGGAAPYWHSYSYDAIGNRTQEVHHSASGDTVRDYTTPGAGQSQPHTVTQVDQTGAAGNVTESYDYDAAGNMVQRTTDTRDQALTWDAEGNLVNVSEASGGDTSYLYDAEGERLMRYADSEATLYLPGMELTWTTGDSNAEATRFYSQDGETVAVRQNDGTLHWVFSDHHQSGQLVMNAASGDTVRRRFTPFGQQRSSTGSWPSERGFVGGTVDASTGLTQLGARAYDADIGRFISVDPVMDLSDPQQMHGYAYANNNPISFTDPNGLWFDSVVEAVTGFVDSAVDTASSVVDSTVNWFRNLFPGGTTTVVPDEDNSSGPCGCSPVDSDGGNGSGDGHGGSGTAGSGSSGSGAGGYDWGYGGSSSGSSGSGGSSGSVGQAVNHDPYTGPTTDPLAESIDAARSNAYNPARIGGNGMYAPGVPPGCTLANIIQCYMQPTLVQLDQAVNEAQDRIRQGMQFWHRHGVISGGGCVAACGGFTYQNGTLAFTVGSGGLGGWGVATGYNHMDPRKAHMVSPTVCAVAPVYGGACVNHNATPDQSEEGFGVQYAYGAGFQVGGNITVLQLELKNLEPIPLTWPENSRL